MAYENNAIDDDVIGTEFGVTQAANSLGRISGKLLNANLLRNGVNLSVRNNTDSPDLLYFEVTDKKIGINTSSPGYSLDISDTAHTTNMLVDTATTVSDVHLFSNSSITTLLNPLIITATGPTPTIVTDTITTDYLQISSNVISSFSGNDVNLTPNGLGKINLNASVLATENLNVTGRVSLAGDVVLKGNITIGDSAADTITINPNFTQILKPGVDDSYDLGTIIKKWNNAYISNLSQVGTVHPNSVNLNNTILFNGTANSITATQANTNLSLIGGSTYVNIEDIKFQENQILNLDNTPLTFASTNRGYLRFGGSGAVVVPVGDTTNYPANPEEGDTRWNRTLNQLECYAIPITVNVTGTNVDGRIIANNTFFSDYIVRFTTSFNGIQANTPYYILPDNLLDISFTISLTMRGDPVLPTATGSVVSTGTVEGQYIVSTGPIEAVSLATMSDLAVVYDLILGY